MHFSKFVLSLIRPVATGLMAASLLVGWGSRTPAAAASFERGPNPTVAALEASTGPFAIGSMAISGATGYGGGTVYFPTTAAQGKYGLVVLCPGIGAGSGYYTWLAERVASWGFVVINMDTTSIFDFDSARATEMAAALKQIAALSKVSSTPFYGEVDTTRMAYMGHSMGGGATLDAELTASKTIKAAVPLAPGGTEASTTNLSPIAVPTMIIGFQKDTVVPVAEFASVYYAQLSPSLDSAYLVITGGDHFSPTVIGAANIQNYIGLMTISWLKRFVDEDKRYDKFINKASGPLVTTYKQGGSY
jgi:dienelactone hydrolase